MSTTTQQLTAVYLHGDSEPVLTTRTVEDICLALVDVVSAHVDIAFIRLPLHNNRGDALVRPDAIVALVPTVHDDGEE